MDRLVLAVLVIGLCLAIPAMAKNSFFISHWCGPTEFTQERIAEVAEANFTVAMIEAGSLEANKRALDLCQANGIKAMVADSRVMARDHRKDEDFAANLDAVVADYADHPALWGYFVMDEPHSSMFKQLAAVNKHLLAKDPDHIPYINLFPTYASTAQLGNPTYEHHVDEFMRVVRPKMLSYDHYALLENTERGDYFENLEIIRRQSIKHKTPFNYILLSLPHGPYRDPSDSDLRWQVNTALAYGAHGIMYFTYTTPPPDPNWNWHDGIIDEHGKRNRKYEEVKKLNAEVLKLAPTLMRLQSVAVYHTGAVPNGAKGLPERGLIERIEGGEFVIGQFVSDDGARYAMLVNRSLREPARANVVFSQRVRLYEVSRESGRERKLTLRDAGAGSVWSARFLPGEGKLMRIEQVSELPVLNWEDLPRFRPRVMLNPSNQYANVIRGDKEGEYLYVEGHILYDLAVKVQDELVNDGRVDVFMSRASRTEPTTLRYETELTRHLNCDVLVSLHSDAMPEGKGPGGGTWTFYADEEHGKRLAECVQMPLLDSIKEFHPNVEFRGVRTHWYRLWVLHEAGCPASLTEVLFHTNPEEREMLKNPKYQDKMAKAIARGILDYFNMQ